jgi:hypothetical protein
MVATKSLRVVFFRIGERIAHRVEAVRSSELQTVFISTEGSHADEWPVSPPLQSVHFERRHQDEVAFLVGMAGRNHWSASVTADATLDRIVFDIACRAANEPACLGSTYELIGLPGAVPSADLPLIIDGVAPLAIETAGSKLQLSMLPGEGNLPRTIRWTYSIAAF